MACETWDPSEELAFCLMLSSPPRSPTRVWMDHWMQPDDLEIVEDDQCESNVNIPRAVLLEMYHMIYYMDHEGFQGLVNVVREKGWNINTKDYVGGTLLHGAVRHRNPVAVEVLIQAGANVNLCDNYGETPLLAAQAKSLFSNSRGPRIMQLLTNSGAR